MSMYVKKKDGTIVESQCETVKVTENTLTKILQGKSDATYFFQGYTGSDLTDILEYDATKNIITASNMFRECRNLITIPLFNTENIVKMNSMFMDCKKINKIPKFNTNNVSNMSNMFNGCNDLTDISLIDTSNVTDFTAMFQNCYSLITIPLFNTQNATSLFHTFYQCLNLKIIPALNLSNVTNISSVFAGCSNLEEIHFTGLKVSFDISASTKFTESALVEILNNLGTPTSSQTLTMSARNLAKLTDEEKAIATDKGWTLK